MKKKKIAIGLAVFALALGGGITYYNSQNQVPELITYVDTDGSIEIPDEDVPLAKSIVPQLVEYTDIDDGSIIIPEEEVPL